MLTLGELESRIREDDDYRAVFGDNPPLLEDKKAIMGKVLRTFKERFHAGKKDEVSSYFVPGRIEVLGKHTDYAGGHSLLIAIDRGFHCISRLNTDGKVRIHEADPTYGGREFPFSSEPTPVVGDWGNYPMTTVKRLHANFSAHQKLQGVDIAFGCDLPPAGGMSGSSALMIMTFFAIASPNRLFENDVFRRNMKDNMDLAMYLACVENGQTFGELVGGRGVGTFGGSEDHTEILNAKRAMLSIFQFCPTVHKADVAFPDDIAVVVAHSGVKAEKTREAMEKYNLVSKRAALVVQAYNRKCGTSHSLMREITEENRGVETSVLLAGVAEATTGYREGEIDLDLPGRFRQFYYEDQVIIPNAARFLINRDYERLGETIDRSHHASKRYLWNIIPEIDFLQKSARRLGALAASGFGAGFGGSAYALVRKGSEESFSARWGEAYREGFPEHGTACQFFTVSASEKATELFPGTAP